jgi:RNA polymerase sigma factor (TIGR02999 family)
LEINALLMPDEAFDSEEPLVTGEPAEALFAALYYELRRLSRYQLSRGGSVVSMSATTLLHKAYIDMAGHSPQFGERQQFIGYAARVMRGIIVDHARHRCAQKRGGPYGTRSQLPDLKDQAMDDRNIILISDALDELANVDAALVEIVNLKFFCGFSFAEIAAMQGVSERTVQRGWEKARLYLHQSIRPETVQA